MRKSAVLFFACMALIAVVCIASNVPLWQIFGLQVAFTLYGMSEYADGMKRGGYIVWKNVQQQIKEAQACATANANNKS